MSARAKSPAAATRPAPEARSAAAGPPERSERWGRGSAHGGLSQSGLTIGLGAASTVLGGLGLTLTSQIVFAVVGTAAAVVALVFANPVARYVVLGVAVAGPAIPGDRPPAWQLVLVAAAVTGFVLAPEADRRDLTSLLAAAAGIPLAGAVTVLAEHQGRAAGPYLVGLAALIVAFFVAVRPAARENL